ncbi:MAG: HAD family hydrolase [Victivallales bacterium]|nr:HAD family hydrolase [Victivallales bacterium]
MHQTSYSGHCRFIVADVDGTFISSDRQLIQENLESIRLAREAGIKFSFATGRYWRSLHPLAQRLGLRAPQIHDNGATLFDPVGQKVLDSITLDEETARFFFKGFRAAGFTPSICTPMDYFYAPPEGDTVISLHKHNEFPIKMESDEAVMDAHANNAVKVAAITESEFARIETTLATLEREAKRRGMRCSTVCTEQGIVAANMENINKMTGVDMACKFLGINREDVVAIGDGDNDTEMLEFCGLGIAMANATDKAKSVSSHVVASNNDAGFAQAIHLVLDGKL